jgi:hypothetical protein
MPNSSIFFFKIRNHWQAELGKQKKQRGETLRYFQCIQLTKIIGAIYLDAFLFLHSRKQILDLMKYSKCYFFNFSEIIDFLMRNVNIFISSRYEKS